MPWPKPKPLQKSNMKPTDTTDLSEILNCSYYDHRTDYVWQYILNNQRERRRDYLCIRNLESFVAMGEMLKCRQYDIPTFMKEWENTEHPGLLECSYNERSGILRLKSRTFTFVYRSRTNEYLFTAYAAVARGCMLKNRETYKKYVKGDSSPSPIWWSSMSNSIAATRPHCNWRYGGSHPSRN